MMQRIPWAIRILVVLGWTILAVFPPWDVGLGSRYGFVLSPPDWSHLTQTIPRIDWITFVQGFLLIGGVGLGTAWILRAHAETPDRARGFPGFTWGTFVVSALLALVLPVPFSFNGPEGLRVMPPLGMWPFPMYLDSNHGIPILGWLIPIWFMLAVFLFVFLGLFGIISRWLHGT